MANQLSLSILTPERVVFEGVVKYLSVPGSAGYMGVLVDHAPIISSLKPGAFEVRPAREGASPITFTTQKPGFLEIDKNKASILLDATDSDALASKDDA
jgi:F-type H+-transporting ATPase subunit epsilon